MVAAYLNTSLSTPKQAAFLDDTQQGHAVGGHDEELAGLQYAIR
jgi:hypothetical protein